MSGDSYSTPVRVDWTADWSDAEVVARIVDELLAGGVFFVTIDGDYLGVPGLGLRRLFDAVAVTVRVQGRALTPHRARELMRMPPALVLIEVDDDTVLPSLADTVAELLMAGLRTGVCFVPARDNVHHLPAVLDQALDAGAHEMHLPNPDLSDATGRGRYMDPLGPFEHAMLAEAAAQRGAAWREGLELHVHDGFLWRLLHPTTTTRGGGEHGGCQAGGARAHVDARGQVLACNAMPIRIGSLLSSSLESLWEKPARAELRERIEARGDLCNGCGIVEACQGGCRGHAWLSSGGSLDGLDPTCAALGARVARS